MSRVNNQITSYNAQDVLDTCFLHDGEVWCFGRPGNKAKTRQVDYCVNHQHKVRVTEYGQLPIGSALILTAHYILVNEELPSGPVFMDDNNNPVCVSEALASIMRNKNKSHVYEFTDGKSRIKSYGVRLQDMNGNRQGELFETRQEAVDAVPGMFDKYWGSELKEHNLYNKYMENI